MKLKKGKYKHFKSHQLYEVLEVALHTETLEEMVVYRALYDSDLYGNNALWVRPLKMFTEMIDAHTTRFQYIEASENGAT